MSETKTPVTPFHPPGAAAPANAPAAQSNGLLEALNRTDPCCSTSRFRSVSFQRGDALGEAGGSLDRVLFVMSGMISLVVELQSGDRVEAGILGRHSVLGAAAAFGQKVHIVNAIGQIPGTALSLSVQELAELVSTNPQAGNLLHAHEQFLRAQAQQTAACNAKHHIPARLATWLLRVRDAMGSTSFDITQEFVAEMLGVQRASVSLVASAFQDDGLISYRRGHIRIQNEAGLKETACECYRALERHHNLLFGSFAPVLAARSTGKMR